MKPYIILFFVCFAQFGTAADAADAVQSTSSVDIEPAELLYEKRPVVVFADTPKDPKFIAQMRFLAQNFAAIEERDILIITDTDPAAQSVWRKRLRPHGFSLVLMSKEQQPIIRKPLPWSLREITAAVDKFPLRRQEMQDRAPSGR